MVNDKSLEKLELEIAMMVRGLRNAATEGDETQNLRRASYFILLIISDKGPMSVKDMAKHLHLDISTISRQAADLLKKGLLEKKPSETDRRSYSYEITEKGWEILASNREGRQDRFQKMIDRWDEGEIEEFARLLRNFNSLLDSE
ncbi:MarR family winged helix-turn-helix transcriptional regulator [Salinicoccus sp. HZC-1]|uniref:MarR family winged helix-turn-helix transcriptional regulator n=1 Tax=Salinicoccus sp. HZC-1 TaxID=3385497 RepID=UPI00398AE11B